MEPSALGASGTPKFVQSAAKAVAKSDRSYPTFHFSPKAVGVQWGLFSLLIFEIKDLTYNAQFNFCLLSTPSFLGAFFDRSELAHSAPINLPQLALRSIYSRGVV